MARPLAVRLFPFLGLVGIAPPAAPQEVHKLLLPDPAKYDQFGTAVGLSGDRAVVGVPYRGVKGAGRVYVFDVQSGQKVYTLKSSGKHKSGFFGQSIATSGRLALIGAPGEYLPSDKGKGRAYVVDVPSGTELHQLTNPDAGSFEFGEEVALDGTLAVIRGHPSSLDSATYHVFDAVTGTHLMEFTGRDHLAFALAGHRLVIGMSYKATSRGVSVRDALTGKLLHQLQPTDPPGNSGPDGFGTSVAASGDLAVVGEPDDDEWGTDAGAVYVFDLTSGQQLAKLHARDPQPQAGLGSRLAMEGTVVVAGSQGPGGPAAYVFDVSTGAQLAKLVPSDGTFGVGFGSALAIDCQRVLAGAPYAEHGGVAYAGIAYLFRSPPPSVGISYCGPANPNSSGQPATIAGQGTGRLDCGLPLVLTARGLPPHQGGYFLTSLRAGFVPFLGGSQGNLCLGAGSRIARFAGQTLDSGPGGRFQLTVDLGALPLPAPPLLHPGDTLHFQAWFRDVNPTPTSNFTDGLAITFE